MLHGENGLAARLFDCIDKAARASCRRNEILMFETLEAYIDEYSGFSDLVLDNFRSIFLYYFLFCSLVFAAFSMYHLANLAKRRIKKRIILKLSSWFGYFFEN